MLDKINNAFKNGNREEAFSLMVATYRVKIIKYLEQYTNDHLEAEDGFNRMIFEIEAEIKNGKEPKNEGTFFNFAKNITRNLKRKRNNFLSHTANYFTEASKNLNDIWSTEQDRWNAEYGISLTSEDNFIVENAKKFMHALKPEPKCLQIYIYLYIHMLTFAELAKLIAPFTPDGVRAKWNRCKNRAIARL